jgi:hypothetical protein
MDINIGKGITLPVDVNALPANAMAHVVYIGLRNILMDAHAGEKDADNSRAVSEKKLAALMSGEVRVTGTREGNPVKAEAIRIATDRIKTALRKAGKKLSDIDPKAIRDRAAQLVDKDESIMAMATTRVAQVKSADVDVGDLI